jgi:hypothetical protein
MLLKFVKRAAKRPLYSDEVKLGLRCVAENSGTLAIKHTDYCCGSGFQRSVFYEVQAFGVQRCYSALFGSWLPEILRSPSLFVELVSNVEVILFSGNF